MLSTEVSTSRASAPLSCVNREKIDRLMPEYGACIRGFERSFSILGRAGSFSAWRLAASVVDMGPASDTRIGEGFGRFVSFIGRGFLIAKSCTGRGYFEIPEPVR